MRSLAFAIFISCSWQFSTCTSYWKLLEGLLLCRGAYSKIRILHRLFIWLT